MPSQRPYFLSSFLAAFRQTSQPPPSSLSASAQTNKHHNPHGQSSPVSTSAQSPSHSGEPSSSGNPSPSSASGAGNSSAGNGGVMSQLPLHSPRSIPNNHGGASGRRRGSDSSSEGFRDVLGADKFYVGGRTAGGEERFFKLGVVKRVRSQDRLSLDRLSL